MYRRSAYDDAGGYRNESGPEDYNLFRRMVKAPDDVVHVPHPVIEYRQHSGGQQNTVLGLERDIVSLREVIKRNEMIYADIINKLMKEHSEHKKNIEILERKISLRDEKIEELMIKRHSAGK